MGELQDWRGVQEKLAAGDRAAFLRVARLLTGVLAQLRAYDFRDEWDDLRQEVRLSVIANVREGRIAEPEAFVAYPLPPAQSTALAPREEPSFGSTRPSESVVELSQASAPASSDSLEGASSEIPAAPSVPATRPARPAPPPPKAPALEPTRGREKEAAPASARRRSTSADLPENHSPEVDRRTFAVTLTRGADSIEVRVPVPDFARRESVVVLVIRDAEGRRELREVRRVSRGDTFLSTAIPLPWATPGSYQAEVLDAMTEIAPKSVTYSFTID